MLRAIVTARAAPRRQARGSRHRLRDLRVARPRRSGSVAGPGAAFVRGCAAWQRHRRAGRSPGRASGCPCSAMASRAQTRKSVSCTRSSASAAERVSLRATGRRSGARARNARAEAEGAAGARGVRVGHWLRSPAGRAAKDVAGRGIVQARVAATGAMGRRPPADGRSLAGGARASAGVRTGRCPCRAAPRRFPGRRG